MRKYIWVLLAYLFLSLVLTWPMAAQLAAYVPGDGIDDPALAWNLWWVKHSLVDQPQNPFACNWQFWPIGINLAFYTLTILNGLLSIPLQAAFGILPAYNILLLSSFVLSGFGAYLLCLDFLRGGDARTRHPISGSPRLPVTLSPRHLVTLSSFLGGALYAFASAKMFYAALGQGNIASSQWIPFAMLYVLRTARKEGGTRDAVLAALFLILQAYAELTYASFLLVFIGLVVVWRLVAASSAAGSFGATVRWLIARFALLGMLFAVGIAPVLANMLPDLRSEGDFFTSGGGFADVFSADLAAYAVPTQLHPFLGGVIRGWVNDASLQADGRDFAVNKGQHIYVGYVALTLAAAAVWHGRRRGGSWFWATAALLFFLLTLGPSLRIAGADTGIPLPFRLFEQLPFFKGNRYPSRYSVMLLASLAPLVALGAHRLLVGVGRLRRGGRDFQSPGLSVGCFAAILIVLLFEHLSLPLPASNLGNVPALYDIVAAEPGDFTLLELPLGWRNGARVAGKQDVLIMQQLWYQTSHGKRLLGGNTSRNPEFKFQYFSENPTLARLIALTNAADLPQHDALRATLAALPVTDDDQAAARAWAAFLNIRYVMVHRDKLPFETEALLRELLPLTMAAEEGDLALYRVTEPLTQSSVFFPGTDQGRSILGEGWSPPAGDSQPASVYAQRHEARLLLPLPPDATTIRLDGQALASGQSVRLVVDGRAVGEQSWPQGQRQLEFIVPADPARPPLSDVRLRFALVTPVAELAQQLSRPGPVGVLVRSAGQETGDFAHIYIAGVERSLNQRGYNLVAFDPVAGVLAAASFDTHADPTASAGLARWVAALPAGAAVAGAVRDEATAQLTEEGVAALARLGVAVDLRGRFRWGHAFIGQVGAAPGAAREAIDGVLPAQVSSGLPLSEPEVAVALERVEIVQ